MQRATVLIGVRKSGDLPELQAVEGGIDAMEHWALAQGMDRDLVVRLTDGERGEVDVGSIYEALDAIVERATVDQLVVYFAGHGVNKGYSEYWLLSDAPRNANEAVNVAGSAELAKRCGIPHVIIVSDACRTLPESIDALSVTGGMIFPSQTPRGPAAKIDTFYACLLGDPAHEIADPVDAARVFRSVYTDVLVDSLMGRHPELLEPEGDGSKFSLVRSGELEEALPELVVARLRELKALLVANQTPEATVTSNRKTAWLSRVEVTAQPRRGGRRRSVRRAGGGTPPRGSAAALLQAAMAVPPISGVSRALPSIGPEALVSAATRLEPEFGPLHYETECGLKLRGETLSDAASSAGGLEVLTGDLLRLTLPGRTVAADVLLRFASGACALVPAVRGFITGLSFEDGRLVDVDYTPSEYRPAGIEYRRNAAELRRTRAIVATASRFGLLKPEGDEDARGLADRVIELSRLDPSLAVYAAYALLASGQEDFLPRLHASVRAGLGVGLFDLAMLAGVLGGRSPAQAARTRPGMPMLARGWALHSAFGVRLPATLDRLPGYLVSSVWTLFDWRAYEPLRTAMREDHR